MIAGISMVKDEVDVIGTVLDHMLASGVDEIWIADNLSTDGTRELLLEFDGPVNVFDDREVGYYQSAKMTALAHLAGQERADWIIPFDADEVWYGTDGTLAEVLNGAAADVLPARTYEHVPQSLDPDGPNPLVRIVHRRKDLKAFPKMAFRYQPDVVIDQGNHNVQHSGRVEWGLLEIREFQYRSLDHLIRKTRNGKAAYDATDLSQSEGAHWRRLGSMTDRELGGEWAAMTRPDGLVYDPAPVLP